MEIVHSRSGRLLPLAACSVLGALVLLVPALSAAGDAAGETQPSVLLLTEGYLRLDFNYLRAIHNRGLAIDYMGTAEYSNALKDGTLAAKLAKYNAVVMINSMTTGVPDPAAQDRLAGVLADYARSGGGVLLMPNPRTGDMVKEFEGFAKASQKHFGASSLLGQWIRESDSNNVAETSHPMPTYQWTDNLADHEITRGVGGIWYSASPYYVRCTTEALDIKDEAWQVLLRASKTARTIPAGEVIKAKDTTLMPVSPKSYGSEPPLLAVRAMGRGRAAYMPMEDLCIWCNGYTFQHGSTMDENAPGYALGGKLKGRTSGLETLIDNTLRWLAAPSMARGKPGGYVQDPGKIIEPRPAPQPALNWKYMKFDNEVPSGALEGPYLAELKKMATYHFMADQWEYWKDTIQWGHKPYKGLIGARSTYSDGKASVQDMAKAARGAGLDFLVFLDRFDMLTPEKWEALKKDCAAMCDDTFCVLPGWTFDSNRNHSMFVFGSKVEWPGKKYLTADGKQANFAATPEVSGLNLWIEYSLTRIEGMGGQIGYYHFTAPAPDGQVRAPLYDLRLYSSIGLYYYEDGKLIEGPDQNWEALRDVNDLYLCIKPFAIDIVRDPATLQEAARSHALTRAIAKDAVSLPHYLRYDYRNFDNAISVSPAAGPAIRRWAGHNRDYAIVPLQMWVTPNYRWRCQCHVTSESGIDSIEIVNGVEPFARIKLNGAKDFNQILDLSHGQQKQLMMVVTDVKGNKAYSGALSDGNHVSMQYFCGDRINGGMFHGPGGAARMGFGVQRGKRFEVKGYDSTDASKGSELWFHTYVPDWDLGPDAGSMQRAGAAHCTSDFWSESAHIWGTSSEYNYPDSEHIIHAWYTYGPLLPRRRTGVMGWRSEICGQVQKSEYYVNFREDGTIKFFPGGYIDNRMMGVLPGNRTVFACAAGPRAPVQVFNIPAQLPELLALAKSDFRIGKGGFAACYGSVPASGACNLYVTDDYKRSLVPGGGGAFIGIETFPAGTPFKKGDCLTARVLQIVGNTPPASGAWWYQALGDWIGLDGAPDIKLKLKAGTQAAVTDGFCDIAVGPQGYADMTFEPDVRAPIQELGVRLKGVCSRWSMMEYRPNMPYVQSVNWFYARYSLDLKRPVSDGLRPIGSYRDLAYVPVLLPKTGEDSLQILAGHPVTASDRRVFVTVTALSWQPYTYVVAVNNPTDEALKVTLKPGLPLPGFDFKEQTVELKPGDYREIFRNGE